MIGCSLKQPDSRSRVFKQQNSAKNPEKLQKQGNSGKYSQRRAKQNALRGNDPRSPASFSPSSKSLLPTTLHTKDQALMVLIDRGEYRVGVLDNQRGTIGPDDANTSLTHLRPFYIDRLETTVAQYKKFDPQYDEKRFTDGKECPTCPAMGIKWLHAYRYCQWAGKRLPTETEWMTAARGQSNHFWPWGNQFSAERANLAGKNDGALSVTPVGSYPKGASPYGAMDMAGNVWEWVSTPYSSPQKEWQTKPLRIVKGGGWTSDERVAKVSFRNIVDASMENPTFGFRCTKSIETKKSAGGTLGNAGR